MNSNFTDEQIKAYAKQFRDGDAIFVNNNWERVIACRKFEITTENDEIDNSFLINRGVGVVEGFRVGSKVAHPYRVTTLEHYKLQGGEKIVWLGESDRFRTFGKTYEVDKEKRYCDDDGISLPVMNNLWGVIPRYAQVSKENQLSEEENYEKDLMLLLERKYEAVEKKQNELKIESEKLKNKLEEIELELGKTASSKTKIAMVMDLFKEDIKLESDKIVIAEEDIAISVYVGDQLMMEARPINTRIKSE